MDKVFDYVVNTLQTYTDKNQHEIVSRQEYEIFCKEYVFYQLKGISFGQAFCERFNIDHFIIKGLSGYSAKDFIEKHGFVK